MTTTTAAATESLEDRIFRRRWLILGILCTSLMIVIVGNTSLNVALPRLAEDLQAPTSDLQWIVDAYSLVFAGVLLTAGALGDRFGRKGALQLGLLIFGAGIVAGALSTSSTQLIASRAVMGLGAAFVMPATLSILTNVFPVHERAKAIAIWAGISGGGAALGPIASGLLLEHFGWNSVFLVNLPLVAFALVAGYFLVPKSSDPSHAPLDFVGAGLSIVALSTLVYAIIEAPIHGWGSSTTLAMFAAAVALLVAFGVWEARCKDPMLQLGFFKDRRFSVSSGGITLVFFAMFGVLFLVSQYLQLVLGYGPLESGVRLLPMSIVMMFLAPLTPRLVHRVGANKVAGTGLVLVAGGLALFSTIQVDTSYPFLLTSLCVLAAGMALTMSPMTTELMASVPPAKAGVGSAMNDTTRELGGALGVALLGSLVTSQYASGIASALNGVVSGPAADAAGSGLAGALAVSSAPAQFGLSPEVAVTIRSASQQACVDGLSVAAVVGAAIVAVAAIAVFMLLPSDRKDFAGSHDELAADAAAVEGIDLAHDLDAELVGATFDADADADVDDDEGTARRSSGPGLTPSPV
jgi:EmrB/QacA subfamily drug resistance transporter